MLELIEWQLRFWCSTVNRSNDYVVEFTLIELVRGIRLYSEGSGSMCLAWVWMNGKVTYLESSTNHVVDNHFFTFSWHMWNVTVVFMHLSMCCVLFLWLLIYKCSVFTWTCQQYCIPDGMWKVKPCGQDRNNSFDKFFTCFSVIWLGQITECLSHLFVICMIFKFM